MTKRLIGYVAWDFAENKPVGGTRRWKVWTTELECLRQHGLLHRGSNRYGVKPVFVEVGD